MISLILSSLTDPIILVLKQICFTYGYISSCRFVFHFLRFISSWWFLICMSLLSNVVMRKVSTGIFKWMSEYCIASIQQLFSYIMASTSYNQWNDDDVCFILDQHAEFDLYSASSQKQQSADSYVALLGHILLIPSQPVVALTP